MRHALILAGGSGTRLWPMSRENLPKQLIPFLGGRSLLQAAADRLKGGEWRIWICAGRRHEAAIRAAFPGLPAERFLGEPEGRDTLNAVGFGVARIAAEDPDATVAVFPADQVIEPPEDFRRLVERGCAQVEAEPGTLLTFGVTPTHPATGYGYLELGGRTGGAATVTRFQEKPDAATAAGYVAAGPERYLWNSGMFVWRAATLLDCIRRYAPENHAGLLRIAAAPPAERERTADAVYPGLKKISIDYAVMEPASRDPQVRVAALPLSLRWLDVGSWPMFAETCGRDGDGNASSAARLLLHDSRNNLVVSGDPRHLVALVGCENLIVVHTPDATLVCPAAKAEAIKQAQREIAERFGGEHA